MKPLSAIFLFACVAVAQTPGWNKSPVLDTSRSPHAILHGVPVSAVTVRDGFWFARRKASIEVSIPTSLEMLEQTGEIDNIRRVAGEKNVPRRGRAQSDADVYKWLEAVGFAVGAGDASPQIRRAAESVIGSLAAAQEPSGYIFSGFMGPGQNAALRHTEMNRWHELYTTGHLLQAGIAWYRATSDRKLLDVGIRMVEYLLRNFGPDKKPIFEGHPGIEMALIELYRTVPERRYLDLAAYFLNGDERNMKAIRPADLVYLFSVSPFTSRTRLEGHAVRAMYACSGATDYFLETGNENYWSTLSTLWEDMVRHKMYITGGLGARSEGEAIGDAYELPNSHAYTESCAAIGNVLWNWRLLHATGDARYTDVLERALYNGVNSGFSLDGRMYCYRNPLEIGPGTKMRNNWYSVPCCPPNLERVMASLPGYFYSTSKDGVWIHLFDNAEMNWKLEDGTPLRVSQQTRYPWDGKVAITVTPQSAKEFTVFVRKPSWSPSVRVAIGGEPLSSPPVQKGYFAIHRAWKPGDQIQLQFGMTPRLVIANPSVRDDVGKVAVERGPLVYVAESLDQPAGTTVFEWQLAVSPGAESFKSVWKPDMLGGIVTLAHSALRAATPSGEQPLYQYLQRRNSVPGEVTLIPYYAFQNREPTSMSVWIPYRESR